MKRGLVRFWSRLAGCKAKPEATLAVMLATSDLSEDEILGHIIDLRERLAAKPHKKPYETVLYNLGGSIAVELVRQIHGPVGTLSLLSQLSPQEADFTIDVIGIASEREIDWKLLVNGEEVEPDWDGSARTWVIGSRRRLVSGPAASAV